MDTRPAQAALSHFAIHLVRGYDEGLFFIFFSGSNIWRGLG